MYSLLVLATEAASEAPAQAAAGGSAIAQLLPLLLIGLVFYFLIIRPQRNRQKTQRDMLGQMEIGDRIVTIGGIHGTIADVSDDIIRLELAPSLVVTIAKSAVARVLTEPSLDVDDATDDEDLDYEEEILEHSDEDYIEDPDLDHSDDEEPRDRRDQ